MDPATVHLNHGSFGAVPREVLAHQRRLHSRIEGSPLAWYADLPDRIADARTQIAPLVGARAQDTVFVPNASGAATVVFNSLQLAPGSQILVTDHGYGAVRMGARRLAQRFGAELRTLHVPLLAGPAEVIAIFDEAITASTRLVVLDQVTSPTASRLPTREITRLAHERGARVLVDGAHGPGLIDAPAEAAGGDWWFGNLHKWTCAPHGAAVLVTQAPDRDDLWPLIDSWAAQESYPQRFDSQGTIDMTPYLSAATAWEFIEREYGWQRTRETMAVLADYGARVIADALAPHVDGDPLVDLPSPVASMRLIRLPRGLLRDQREADALRTAILRSTSVECAFTSVDNEGFLRLSAHLYTEPADAEAFVERCVPLIVERWRSITD